MFQTYESKIQKKKKKKKNKKGQTTEYLDKFKINTIRYSVKRS